MEGYLTSITGWHGVIKKFSLIPLISVKKHLSFIHFILIRDAYIDANPGNIELENWLNNILEKFDGIYSKDRPGFIEGYKKLKESITAW